MYRQQTQETEDFVAELAVCTELSVCNSEETRANI